MKLILIAMLVMACFVSAMADVDYTQPFVPDSHTRGLWHFDEVAPSSTAADASGNLSDGTLVDLDATASWAPSMAGFGNSLNPYWVSSVDYNRGKVQVPYDVALNFGAGVDQTIEFWMNPQNGGPYWRAILFQGDGAAWKIQWYNQQIYYGYYFSGWRNYADTTVIPLNVWTHVAITIDRTSNATTDIITFWINGELSSVVEPGHKSNVTKEMDLAFLNRADGTYGPTYQYYGRLDEVRLSNILRNYGGINPPTTPDTQTSRWFEPYDGSTDNTVLLLHLNETTGSTAYDAAPLVGNNDGQLTSPFDGRSSTEVPDPIFDRSLMFTGNTNEMMQINYDPAFDLRYEMTIEAWVYPTNFNLITQRLVTKPYCYSLHIVWDRLFGVVYNGGTNPIGVTATKPGLLPKFKWSHIAMVYDAYWEPADDFGNRVRLFIDGVEVTTDEIDTTFYKSYNGPISVNTAPVFVDYATDVPPYEGYMDELRISNVARNYEVGDETQITSITASGDDIELAFNSAKDGVYVVKSKNALTDAWQKLDGVNGDFLTTLYTDVNGSAGVDKKFYSIEKFQASSMGYVEINTKTAPAVNGLLNEWAASEIVATRDNFYNTGNAKAEIPYCTANVYAAYDASASAYYVAYEMDEQTSSDVLELMVCDDANSSSYQIRFDKGGQFAFYVMEESADPQIHPRWDTAEGDTYTYSDFIRDGGQFAQLQLSGTWTVELVVPFSWINVSYSFGSGDQNSLYFNWEAIPNAINASTNPRKAFWPVANDLYISPEVGVTRQ